MSRKNTKRQKPPPGRFKGFSGVCMRECHEKIINQFEQWAACYARCCNKADKKIMTRDDFSRLMSQTLGLSNASRRFITAAIKNHGRHYLVTEKQVYEKEDEIT